VPGVVQRPPNARGAGLTPSVEHVNEPLRASAATCVGPDWCWGSSGAMRCTRERAPARAHRRPAARRTSAQSHGWADTRSPRPARAPHRVLGRPQLHARQPPRITQTAQANHLGIQEVADQMRRAPAAAHRTAAPPRTHRPRARRSPAGRTTRPMRRRSRSSAALVRTARASRKWLRLQRTRRVMPIRRSTGEAVPLPRKRLERGRRLRVLQGRPSHDPNGRRAPDCGC